MSTADEPCRPAAKGECTACRNRPCPRHRREQSSSPMRPRLGLSQATFVGRVGGTGSHERLLRAARFFAEQFRTGGRRNKRRSRGRRRTAPTHRPATGTQPRAERRLACRQILARGTLPVQAPCPRILRFDLPIVRIVHPSRFRRERPEVAVRIQHVRVRPSSPPRRTRRRPPAATKRATAASTSGHDDLHTGSLPFS
jgi:hypothetical protein